MKPLVYPTGFSIPCPGLLSLSAREWDALLLIADDLRNEELADKLHITPKSAENYRTRIGHKLGCRGNGALARFARQHRDTLHRVHEQLAGKLPPENG